MFGSEGFWVLEFNGLMDLGFCGNRASTFQCFNGFVLLGFGGFEVFSGFEGFRVFGFEGFRLSMFHNCRVLRMKSFSDLGFWVLRVLGFYCFRVLGFSVFHGFRVFGLEDTKGRRAANHSQKNDMLTRTKPETQNGLKECTANSPTPV